MKIPAREEIERLRQEYPPGTRIVLHDLQDAYTQILPGTKGTVTCVDDAGQIHMDWDIGSTLALLPGVDRFEKASPSEKRRSCEQTR